MPEILMPRLSDTMESGVIVRWHKHAGDQVTPGETLAEIETDKAVMEYEAYEAGVLGRILVPEGEEAAIGDPIAILGNEQPAESKALHPFSRLRSRLRPHRSICQPGLRRIGHRPPRWPGGMLDSTAST